MSDKVEAHIKITGRVQGVGFRYWTIKEAKKRNLSGWVRNRRDGSVEVFFSGNQEDVSSMLSVCKKGPVFSKVVSITPVSTKDAPMPPYKEGEFDYKPTV
jgi:acylphosphatase